MKLPGPRIVFSPITTTRIGCLRVHVSVVDLGWDRKVSGHGHCNLAGCRSHDLSTNTLQQNLRISYQLINSNFVTWEKTLLDHFVFNNDPQVMPLSHKNSQSKRPCVYSQRITNSLNDKKYTKYTGTVVVIFGIGTCYGITWP